MKRNLNRGRLEHQVRRIGREQRSDGGMPFASVLHPQTVQAVLDQLAVHIRQCVLSPLMTLYAFLAQVMAEDKSCQQAVAGLLAWMGPGGGPMPSGDAGPYCKARARLPEELPKRLAEQVGRDLHQRHGAGKLLGGRRIKIVDGTTLSMPDTPANQAEYPQPRTQKPGVGFPILRLVAVMCLGCGAMLTLASGPYLGKQTGETALLRSLLEGFAAEDIVLGDRYFCSYWMISAFRRRGVDVIFRMHQIRKVDFRKGRRLGHHDHVMTWKRPKERPEWMDAEQYAAFPETMEVRQMKVPVRIPGFRVRVLVLATTLLDAQAYPAEELAQAFRARWNAELDLRSIKAAMHMDVLRCKSPAMVRKELWMHVLAYNLIRTVMAQAAQRAGHPPREISFTAAMQLLRSFAPVMAVVPEHTAQQMHQTLLEALSRQVVGDRPDRCEPRAIKRRPKPHKLLNVPRDQARRKAVRHPA